MKVKVDEIAILIPGVNQSRIKINFNEVFYDQTMFELDANNMFQYKADNVSPTSTSDIYLVEGDVVISSSTQLSTIVGPSDRQRILTANFIKVNLKSNTNKYFFVYLYNFNQNIKRQKEKATQTMGLVQRLTLKSIGKIEVPKLSMEKQLVIGRSYLEMLKLYNKTSQFSALFEKLTYSILEENIGEK